MGRIYLGPNSFFKIPNPKSKKKKAIVNIFAQALDFADFDTVVFDRGKFRKAKFNYGKGKGKKNVSFVARSKIIMKYAPKSADKVVMQINELAKLYAQGKISRREYLRRVDATIAKHLPKKEREKIKRIVFRRD
ncbi:hypothetical protein DRP04_09195 [Archaeoglobales archaeon]|nr:MAG: hypothetical protein DRP04_09195 [Archaeoglobales archaeon]